jgi:hypothetical protein
MAYVKDPGEKKDYAIDWAAHLATSETISTSTWVVQTGITQTTPAPSNTTTTTTIWLSGGTEGTEYRITNHVVTNQGREFERSFTVNVQQL